MHVLFVLIYQTFLLFNYKKITHRHPFVRKGFRNSKKNNKTAGKPCQWSFIFTKY